MKLPMLQAKTISLLDAPELREYLLASPELLRPGDYMELIAGAPISLKEKREYLTAFLKCGEASYQADAAKYLVVLNRALAALDRAEAGHCVLKIWLVGYKKDDNDTIDGPFMAANLKEAQECMAFYRRNNEDYDDKWDEMYWSLDLYDLSQPHTPEEAWEFRRPEYTFIAEPGGELQYYRHHVSRRMNDEFNVDEFAFGKVTCNLPVPYQPGDILKIDCRPYAPGPVYCVIAEVGDDCCGVQCFYRCGIRCCNPEKVLRIEHGALKYGHYFSGYPSCSQFLSPLYRAKVYHGKLPIFSEFLEPLAEKLREDPGIAQKLYELEHYFTFC